MTAAWCASAKTGQQTLKVTHSCVEIHRLEFQVCLFDLTCNVLHYSTEVLCMRMGWRYAREQISYTDMQRAFFNNIVVEYLSNSVIFFNYVKTAQITFE